MGVRNWALWRLPGRARLLVVALVGGYAAMVVALSVETEFTGSRIVVAAVFSALAVGSIEISMRLAWPRTLRNGRIGRDCLGAWILPVALLLPPTYAAAMVILPRLYVHFRVWRTQTVKLVYSISAVGLAYAGADIVHSAVSGHTSTTWTAAQLIGSGRAQVAILAGAATWWVANYTLVCGIVYLTSGSAPVRMLLRDMENHVVDVVAACVGVALAVLWTVDGVAALLLVPAVLLVQHHLYSDLRQAVRRDFLTDVASSRFWREVAGREVERAWASGGTLALLLIDVDHFKAINDAHGHLMGDAVLVKVASRIAQALRPSDLVGRLGGEEFAAVLSGLSLAEAAVAAERVRAQVAELRVPVEGDSIGVTVSCGVAALGTHGLSLSQLLRAADKAMYAAKAGGRNRVQVAQPGRRVIDLTSTTSPTPSEQSRP